MPLTIVIVTTTLGLFAIALANAPIFCRGRGMVDLLCQTLAHRSTANLRLFQGWDVPHVHFQSSSYRGLNNYQY